MTRRNEGKKKYLNFNVYSDNMKLAWIITLITIPLLASIVFGWLAFTYKLKYDECNANYGVYKNTSISLCNMFNYISDNICRLLFDLS